MRAIAVIPARMASSRLPGKPMRLINGRPMIEHVCRAAQASPLLAQVIVATDSAEIHDFCRAQGFDARMTSPTCRSGADRVQEVSEQVAADVYVNIQGDEPLTRPEHVAALLGVMHANVHVGTLKTPMSAEDARSPNVVKVVSDSTGRALYFSRLPIPFDRDGSGPRYWKHLGLYAYRKPALDRFVAWPEGELEINERLEQLRFLENGLNIYVGLTQYDTIGVDTEDDLRLVEKIMSERQQVVGR